MARKELAPSIVVLAAACGSALAPIAAADMAPEWLAELPVGSSITAGLYGTAVDAAGNTYLAGSTGISSNRDIITARFGPGGELVWSSVYDGPAQWHEGVAGVALGPDGSVYVAGSTPGPGMYANVLLLKYDGATGGLIWDRQFDGGPFTSDGATCIATDGAGNIYVGGSTVGDGGDCLTLKFNSAGDTLWSKVWDGPASAPYSQEAVRGIMVAPDGNPVIITGGVMNSLHPDYVTIKYAASNGALLWQHNFGSSGEDSPSDMAIDAAGDVYVTGTSINFNDRFATVKIRGSDGAQLWAQYDWAGIDDGARAIALDGAGGVYITGAVDPDGDQSNFNDNIYTVKRDAASGAQLWTHLYGVNCIGCYDVPADVLVDPAGHVFVAGSTSSPPYSSDSILLVLDAQNGVETVRSIVPGGTNETSGPRALRLDGANNLYMSGEFYNANTGAVDLTLVRYESMAAVAGDVDGDGAVTVADLVAVITSWGPCPVPPAACSADLTGDGMVDVADLVEVIVHW